MIRARQCTGGIAMPGVRDRVAVVTGAANGLGREIALLLARAGARVALGDLDAAGLDKTAAAITAAGGAAVAIAGGLTEETPANRLSATSRSSSLSTRSPSTRWRPAPSTPSASAPGSRA